MKKSWLILGFCFFLVVVMVFYFYDKKHKNIYEEVKKVYPILGPNYAVSGIVSSIDHPISISKRNDPLAAFVTIDDSIRLHICTGFDLRTGLELEEVLSLDEYLVKDSGSYFFKLLKIQDNDTIEYEFELHDDMGYPLRKQE